MKFDIKDKLEKFLTKQNSFILIFFKVVHINFFHCCVINKLFSKNIGVILYIYVRTKYKINVYITNTFT